MTCNHTLQGSRFNRHRFFVNNSIYVIDDRYNFFMLLYNVPIKAKDPPWFAVQMGSVADSVATKIRIIIDNTKYWSYDITHFFSRIFVCILNTLVYRFQYRILKITQTSSLIIVPISPIKKSPNLKKAGTFKKYQFRGKLLNNLFATFDVNTVFSNALNFAT